MWVLQFLTENQPGSRQHRLLICNIDTSWSIWHSISGGNQLSYKLSKVCRVAFQKGIRLLKVSGYRQILLCMFLMYIIYPHSDIGSLHRLWYWYPPYEESLHKDLHIAILLRENWLNSPRTLRFIKKTLKWWSNVCLFKINILLSSTRWHLPFRTNSLLICF